MDENLKNELVWSFIYKKIHENFNHFLLIKDKSATDGDFFKYISEILLGKLKQETNLLKKLHKNTIRALPKVIIAIFLMYSQKINKIKEDELEKKSGMVGQYKKLRVIANHLCLDLPFIMGDVVEKILEEKREHIFKGEFFPSQEKVCRIDKRLTPSRKMVKSISRWIQKNSEYKNLTELRQIVYERKEKRSKEEYDRFVLLDSDKIKHSIEIRKICDQIIQKNPDITSYADIKRAIQVDVTQYFRKDHRRYIKLSKFQKIQELYGKIPHKKFIKSFTTDKWIFLWQDSEGNPITKKKAIDFAAKYLIEEILKNDTSRYKLDYINNMLGRNDYISALSARGIKYNEILKTMGLEMHSEPGRWGDLNWSSDKNTRSFNEALINAANYLKELMVDYDYEIAKIPSQQYIINRHEAFYGALKRYNLAFYEVLKKAGFPEDKFRKKWWSFDNDPQGNILTSKEQENIILDFFKKNIKPIYVKKGLIEGKLGPSYDEAKSALKDTRYHGFISAANARGISHGSTLLSVGISPRITPNQEAGIAFHWIAENIFMKHTRIDNHCISFYESKSNEENSVRPDNSIIVNENFRKLSKFAREIPSNIKKIHIDYYLIHSSKRSSYKLDRGYQNNESSVLLVPLNIEKSRETQVNNIKILSLYDFCDFFGFSNERKNTIIKYAQLALGSIRETDDSSEKLLKLTKKAISCKEELQNNPSINFTYKKIKV